MTDPHPTPASPEDISFAAPAEHRGRRAGRALAWMAVGALGATALTGIALASSGDGSGSSGTTTAEAPDPEGMPGMTGMPGGRGPGGMGRGMGEGMGGDMMGRGEAVLHGELVVKDGTKTKTVLTQNGTVTAASSTSLTVESTDGFTATWTLDDTTSIRAFAAKSKTAKAADLKVGDKVHVAGAKATSTTGTAAMVHVKPTAAQLKKLRENMPKWPGPDARGPDGKRPAAAPTASSAA